MITIKLNPKEINNKYLTFQEV